MSLLSPNFKKVLFQLMPPGISWEEDGVVDDIVTSAASLFKKVYLLGLDTVKSSPGRGALKPFWDDILDGVRLNHKGIYVDNFLVTNTVPFFQLVIESFGLKNEIKVEVLDNKVWFRGAVIKGPRDDGNGNQLPAERYEDFIDEIERVRLAHIPIFYVEKIN